MRVMQGGMVTLDVWTSDRYYILKTEYVELGQHLIERQGEKGLIPTQNKKVFNEWLNRLFYPLDFL